MGQQKRDRENKMGGGGRYIENREQVFIVCHTSPISVIRIIVRLRIVQVYEAHT